LQERVAAGLDVAWEQLLPHQYSEWLSAADPIKLPQAAGLHFPLDAALTHLDKHGPASLGHPTLTALLSRGPARLGPILKRALTSGDEPLVQEVLTRTPKASTAALARALPPAGELLQLRPSTLESVRGFLLRACRERHPDFQDCYDLLMALEAGLRPLKNLAH
jgi:hypothetical protein